LLRSQLIGLLGGDRTETIKSWLRPTKESQYIVEAGTDKTADGKPQDQRDSGLALGELTKDSLLVFLSA